ncbi:MAG TPA: hypothetical protein VKZ50_04010 [bacterium]|nr:hypothetical protein [bacterium]
MSKSIEKKLSPKLVRGLDVCGLWHQKFEDPPHGHFANGKARFTRPRPFDYIAVARGYAIEVKATRGTSFALRPRQDKELARFERLGAGEAVVAVFTQDGRWWTLWWLPYRAYAAFLRRRHRKSFPVKALLDHAVRCARADGAFIPPIGEIEVAHAG